MAVVSAILSSSVDLKLIPYFVTSLSEMSTKWVLNAISTGSHTLKGKVLGNRMVDLQVRLVSVPAPCHSQTSKQRRLLIS